MPLNGVNLVSADTWHIFGLIFLQETVNSGWYVNDILNPFFN
jgi:hypothetical protein